nr:MAG: major capsid protein [Microvirus sp.]
MRSLHNLSHRKLSSFNQGYVFPIGCIEALPNDLVAHKVSAILRTQPLLAPVMHTCDVKIHHWFVPLRLIWEDFEKFITGGRDGMDETVAPILDTGAISIGSLADHLGLPNGGSLTVSALPFRAYNLVINENYLDQDLQDQIPISFGSGVDTTTPVSLRRGCWNKDYFTSARPTTQKGDDVTIPLEGLAPVEGIGWVGSPTISAQTAVKETGGTTKDWANQLQTYNTNVRIKASGPTGSGFPSVYANLDDVVAVSVNDLRLAVRLQRFKENMLNRGSRMVERLESAFFIPREDMRLDVPEYLGGGSDVVQFSEVLQTAEGIDPVGTLAGHGIAFTKSNRYKYRCTEYGFVLSLAVVRPRTAYMQGIHKMWSRSVKEDYFQPELQNIGMQPIYNKEIYAAHPQPNGVFGFQDRDDSYRFMFDQVSGEFRDTLDFWHMARKFASAPALNGTFVECEGVDRVFATTIADQFLGTFHHDLKIKRLVNQSGRPSVF